MAGAGSIPADLARGDDGGTSPLGSLLHAIVDVVSTHGFDLGAKGVPDQLGEEFIFGSEGPVVSKLLDGVDVGLCFL